MYLSSISYICLIASLLTKAMADLFTLKKAPAYYTQFLTHYAFEYCSPIKLNHYYAHIILSMLVYKFYHFLMNRLLNQSLFRLRQTYHQLFH